MNTIKSNLLEKYTDKNLSVLFFYYHQMTPMEVMYFWNTIHKILNESNVLQILGFILDLQDNYIVFPRYAQKSLNFHIHQVNKKIAKLLPRNFTFYIKNLKLFKFAKDTKVVEAEEKYIDSNIYFANILCDLLIKTSTVEISNAIESYFNFGLLDNLENDSTKKLLFNIKKLDVSEKDDYIKYISLIITNCKEILEYLYYNLTDEDSLLLVEYIYIFNKQIYNDLLMTIYENRKYYRLELLQMFIELDINNLELKDENIEIIKYLVANKPVLIPDLIDVLNSKISKKHLLGIFVEHFDTLKNFKFNLSFEDYIAVSSEKTDFLYDVYKIISDEKQKQTFYTLFKTLDEDFIIKFLLTNEDIDLVSYILTNRQLKGNLKKFIIDNYKTTNQIMYKLFIYLDKSDVIKNIDNLLVDKKSLEYFLLVLKPTDILVYAHDMSNLPNAIKIIDLCFESPGINENDFIFTLNIIEKSMPPLIIRTLILTYKKFSHLKNYTITYLFKLINKNALNDQKLVIGICKCLEILEYSSVDIIASLTEDRMKIIFDKSVLLRQICSKIIYKNENKYKSEYNLLKSVLNRYR